MSIDSINSIAATIGGGFFGGLLLGYAIKKVVKLLAVVVGLFIAGLVKYHVLLYDIFLYGGILNLFQRHDYGIKRLNVGYCYVTILGLVFVSF